MTLRHARWLPAIFVAVCAAQNSAPPPDARTQVDKIFARFAGTTGPGCSAGVSLGGTPVLAAAYGMADLEHNVALTPDTVFEPGSITKQFTAAAVLLLAQQGKLSLDDPARKYIPEIPDYGTPITIRHLLNHTSGLRDWGNVAGIGGWPRTTREYTHAHVLEIIGRQRSLNYPPGAEYSYTNSGFNLLAMLVGRVAGKSLPEFTRENVFQPLGMTSTQWRDDFRRIVPNRAIAYSGRDGSFRQDMPFEDVFGNGGLLTTVGDLLRWNESFTSMKVGGRSFFDAQHERGRLTDGRTIAYAAGLMVLHWRGLNEVSHSGSTAGYSAWLGRYPDQKLSVAVLCNLAGVNATQYGHQVAEVYLGSAAAPHPLPPVTVAPAILAAWAGLYRSVRDHQTLSVNLVLNQLQLERRGPLYPLAGNEYRVGEDGLRVEFGGAITGHSSRMRILTEGDEGNWYEKVERANPAPADLAALAGDYVSDEAEVTFKVAFEKGRLVIHRRPDAEFPLTPTYRDGFSSQLGSIRFLRDAAGAVTELSLGESRVWDLRFRRIR
jgi:CubicO group peptidase (beta-lactamase class C family)